MTDRNGGGDRNDEVSALLSEAEVFDGWAQAVRALPTMPPEEQLEMIDTIAGSMEAAAVQLRQVANSI